VKAEGEQRRPDADGTNGGRSGRSNGSSNERSSERANETEGGGMQGRVSRHASGQWLTKEKETEEKDKGKIDHPFEPNAPGEPTKWKASRREN